jgi:hypothetical protein
MVTSLLTCPVDCRWKDSQGEKDGAGERDLLVVLCLTISSICVLAIPGSLCWDVKGVEWLCR